MPTTRLETIPEEETFPPMVSTPSNTMSIRTTSSRRTSPTRSPSRPQTEEASRLARAEARILRPDYAWYEGTYWADLGSFGNICRWSARMWRPETAKEIRVNLAPSSRGPLAPLIAIVRASVLPGMGLYLANYATATSVSLLTLYAGLGTYNLLGNAAGLDLKVVFLVTVFAVHLPSAFGALVSGSLTDEFGRRRGGMIPGASIMLATATGMTTIVLICFLVLDHLSTAVVGISLALLGLFSLAAGAELPTTLAHTMESCMTTWDSPSQQPERVDALHRGRRVLLVSSMGLWGQLSAAATALLGYHWLVSPRPLWVSHATAGTAVIESDPTAMTSSEDFDAGFSVLLYALVPFLLLLSLGHLLQRRFLPRYKAPRTSITPSATTLHRWDWARYPVATAPTPEALRKHNVLRTLFRGASPPFGSRTMFLGLLWFLSEIQAMTSRVGLPALATAYLTHGDVVQRTLQLDVTGIVASIAGTYFATAVVDLHFVGRRALIVLGSIVSFILLLAPTIARICPLGATILFHVNAFAIAAGPGAVIPLVAAEIVPTRMRGTLFGLAAAVGMVGRMMGVFLGHPMVYGYPVPSTSATTVLSFALGTAAVVAVASAVVVPDMVGLDLAEQDKKWVAVVKGEEYRGVAAHRVHLNVLEKRGVTGVVDGAGDWVSEDGAIV